jgi:predicted phosphate transport protein (TIGR00153 family)
MRFNFLDLLLPRETKFYDLFLEHTDTLLDAARRLRKLAAGLDSGDAGHESLMAIITEIKEIERKADKIESKIDIALEESFITPFDREDIHMIAAFVDNTVDEIKALVEKIETYGIVRLPSRSADFADIILDCSQKLHEAFERMKKKESVSSQVKAIGEAERRADVLFSIAIGDLFKEAATRAGGADAVEMIKTKEVYEGLEEIVNKIDGAGKLLRRVMIKQG